MDKDFHSLSTEIIDHALGRFFINPQATGITPFKLGVENLTALIEGNFGAVVLRVWGERHSRMGERKLTDIQGELLFMEACRGAGLPVPRIYRSLTGHDFEQLPDGRKFGFMDYVVGDEPSHFTPGMIDALGRAVAQMNRVGESFRYPAPRSFQGTIADLAQERIDEFESLNISDEEIIAIISDYRKRLGGVNLVSLPTGPIHGDVMYQNTKFQGEVLAGIFDFDDCRESYFIEDITKTAIFSLEDVQHCVIGNDLVNVRRFMAAYESVRPLSEAERLALPVLYQARFIYEYLKFHLHGASRSDAAEIRARKLGAYRRLCTLFEGPQ